MKWLNPYTEIAVVVFVLAVFYSGFSVGSKYTANALAAKQARAQDKAVAAANVVTVEREMLGAVREVSRERIRVIYRTLKEQAREIKVPPLPNPLPQGERGYDGNSLVDPCGLDPDGLRLWNAANAGDAAPLSGEPDYGLSAPAASAVGKIEGLAVQPYRFDGAVRAVPGGAAVAGGLRE